MRRKGASFVDITCRIALRVKKGTVVTGRDGECM